MKIPLKTLVVEDDERELRVLVKRLDPAIFDVHEATSFRAAVALLTNEKINFDFSILDIKIDDKNCYDLIEMFTAEKFGVIGFTSEHALNMRYLPKNHPPFVLNKPHNKQEIDTLVGNLIGYLNRIEQWKELPFDYVFTAQNNKQLPLKKGRDILLSSST